MKFYLLLLSIAVVVILEINGVYAVAAGFSFWNALLWCGLAFLILFAGNVFAVVLCRILPKKIYNPNSKFFRTYKWENKFYLKIGVKTWKDLIPELGKLGGFEKKKIDNLNADYLYKFLQENCLAELVHIISMFASLLIFFLPIRYWLSIGLPAAFMNLLFNFLPFATQRYLRPKFLALYQHQKRVEDSKNAEKPLKINKNANFL